MTISLWDTLDGVKPLEARAAQVTSQAEESAGLTADPV
jgi:hypothetical protein